MKVYHTTVDEIVSLPSTFDENSGRDVHGGYAFPNPVSPGDEWDLIDTAVIKLAHGLFLVWTWRKVTQ